MDLESYVLESNAENFIGNLNRDEITQISISSDNQMYPEKWEPSTQVKSADVTKAMVSVSHDALSSSKDSTCSLSHKVKIENTCPGNQKSQKGRVSLVRLQAAVQNPPDTEVTPSLTDVVESSGLGLSSAESSSNLQSAVPQLSVASKDCAWTGETGPFVTDVFYSSSEVEQASASIMNSSPGSPDSVPSQHQMRRYLTSDGQNVYGYKDAGGEFHFFYKTLNDRESHNEKERKRRSRVTGACSRLRELVPGLTDKTDKASVFEQAARYLQFLRDKYGTQFDQMYCEKHLNYIEAS